jgi:hypothetical protein
MKYKRRFSLYKYLFKQQMAHTVRWFIKHIILKISDWSHNTSICIAKVLINNASYVDFSYLRIVFWTAMLKRGKQRKPVLIIKTSEMHYFSNLFWYRTLTSRQSA